MSYHGIALNVTRRPRRLRADRRVRDAGRTSRHRSRASSDGQRRADRPPSPSSEAAWIFARAFAATIDAPLDRSRPDRPMASGLFELRKDPITSWWVATVVDRAFHRDRFARAAEAGRRPPVRLRQLRRAGRRRADADAQGIRVPRRRDRRPRPASSIATTGSPRSRWRRRARPARWRTVIAPDGEHRPLHAVGTDLIEGLVAGARDALAAAPRRPADRVPDGRPELGRARPARGPTTCASTCTTCRRSRIASPRSSAARRGS